MHITVELKHQYGNKAYYPVDENAKRVASISGTTTLPVRVLKTVQDMGIKVNVIQEAAKI